MRLQIVGGGKMGEALLGGLISSGWADAGDLGVVELSSERGDELRANLPGVRVGTEITNAADAVIAVKPQHVIDVVSSLAEAGCSRMLSIAAGVRIAVMENVAPDAVIVRCMPNTPALVGVGASAIAGGSRAAAGDLAWAESILGQVGIVVRVDERDLDAVTGLSGSGPAYVFRMAEALLAAGVAEGLDPSVADALTRQTLLGAATLLSESGEDPAVLRQNVTSPGGTTAAGLGVLDDADFEAIMTAVVRAAAERSRELGA